MPSIDVVIPNYQYGRYLPGCVASILAQGIPDTRILIIDNASTDNSVEVAQEIARQDARVELSYVQQISVPTPRSTRASTGPAPDIS